MTSGLVADISITCAVDGFEDFDGRGEEGRGWRRRSNAVGGGFVVGRSGARWQGCRWKLKAKRKLRRRGESRGQRRGVTRSQESGQRDLRRRYVDASRHVTVLAPVARCAQRCGSSYRFPLHISACYSCLYLCLTAFLLIPALWPAKMLELRSHWRAPESPKKYRKGRGL